jgi:hypothetical protein
MKEQPLQWYVFDDLDEAQEKLPDFDFEDLQDYSEKSGKHDLTDCKGMAFNQEGTLAFKVEFSSSYTYGTDEFFVKGPYRVSTEEVTVTRYKYTLLDE